ncbi:MFS transporter [Herbiconiux sp. L3-i23]|uniref:MFS transporter n=1 Tax=Herbiconiux sp. L3-i23 TaxID=2905871 RepID=UPI002048FB9C|nr:MFS transporter [Herbiconiux sp. L3-i23]BDI23586.1 MFS transporter [Herbiconiux sp. L3-i23]
MTGLVSEGRRTGTRWSVLFGVAWLGVWLAQLTPIQLLLPLQIDADADARGGWLGSVVDFGVISGAAGLCALVAFPLAGTLSDRTTSRFGRRRPWIAVGTLIFAAGLVLLALQHDRLGVGIAWCVALTGFCVVSSALTALIGDLIPVERRGSVSAWIGGPQAVGTIAGLLLVTEIFTGVTSGYLAVAAVLVLLVLPFLLTTPDTPADAPRAKLGVRQLLSGLWIDPVAHPDFALTLTGRILVNLGNALGTTLLLYFLLYGLGDRDAEDHLVLLSLIYLVFLVIATFIGGAMSDRLGRRRLFVALAAVFQGIAAAILIAVPSLPSAFVAAALLGIGYGAFLSVDQALATQVLPDPESRGKDLGIMNVAMAVPQAFGPLIGAGLVAFTGGFGAVFGAAAVLSVLGAVAVARVKGVR